MSRLWLWPEPVSNPHREGRGPGSIPGGDVALSDAGARRPGDRLQAGSSGFDSHRRLCLATIAIRAGPGRARQRIESTPFLLPWCDDVSYDDGRMNGFEADRPRLFARHIFIRREIESRRAQPDRRKLCQNDRADRRP